VSAARCSLGINGGEFPHWTVDQVLDLAVHLRAEFVELAAGRVAECGAEALRRSTRARGLGVHVGAMVSELAAAVRLAAAVEAPLVVSRRQSLERFRELAVELLDRPGHERIRLAIENSVIRITRQPEDLLEMVTFVGHPRVGVNFDADNFYNAGIEPFPYAYELLRAHIFQVHVKDSGRYLPTVHGPGRRVLHRAGGNVVCLPVGTGAVNWTGLIARFQQDGYEGPVSLEPHLLPDEMAPAMETDAAFLRRAGWVR
jgi:sugar phosphate isomerase/epimerase